jgi:hypothetical protein
LPLKINKYVTLCACVIIVEYSKTGDVTVTLTIRPLCQRQSAGYIDRRSFSSWFPALRIRIMAGSEPKLRDILNTILEFARFVVLFLVNECNEHHKSQIRCLDKVDNKAHRH